MTFSGARGLRRPAAALLAGASAAALALAAAAQAQDVGAAPAPTTQQGQVPVTAGTATADTNGIANAKAPTVSEVVVTGSRIRGVAPVGSTVIGVSREDITATGATDVVDALQNVPQILNLGVSDTSRATNGGAGNINYAQGINIRGIGPYATLTLLDDRRMVQSGASGGLPDPSNIPTIGLERAEIVPDGASAIYGSDAIAGVANLILRRNFDGIEATAREGTADSYNESQIDLLVGHKWDGGQFTAALERSYHSALNGENRSFYRSDLTSYGGSNFSSPNCNPANIVVGGVSYAGPGYAPGANLCDNLKNEDLIPQQERLNFDFTFNQDLGPYVSFYAEGIAAERNFTFHNGTQNSTVTVPASNAYYTQPPGVASASQTVETNFGGNAPTNTSYGGDKMFQLTSGLDFKLPHNFKLETDYTYGQDTAKAYSYDSLNNGALAAALASGDRATAVNPYGANSTALLSSLYNTYTLAPGDNIQQEAEVKLDGPVYRLPGGDIRVAFGGEYDNTSLYTGFANGVLPDQVFSTRVLAKQEVKAAYGELFIPIIGADNSLPFVRSLTLDAAGRYEDYTDLGSTTNPKVGLNWSPVEGLTIHGSYGTSFRAPQPSAIHGALNGLFVQPYAVPGGGIVQGVALSGIAEGNPLTPETATTYSIGADYQPSFYRNLKLSINYFNIDYEKQITGYLSDLTLLSSAERQAQFSSIIKTGAAAQSAVAALVAQGYPVFGALPASVDYFIEGENFNLGTTKADGLDFSGNLRLPTDGFGTFNVGLNGTYFLDYLVQVTPTSPSLSEANRIFNPLRLRMRGSVNWTYGPASLTAFVNFENSYINDTVTPVQQVDSYTTVDLHGAFAVDRLLPHVAALAHTSILVDVTNVFDKDPPFVNVTESTNGGGGFDPTAANPIGRLVSVAIDKRF